MNIVPLKTNINYYIRILTQIKRSVKIVEKRGVRSMEEVYTVQEVAQNLKVSERTVRNWIESGELPAFPIGKRGYRISKADLQAFIDERKKRNLDIKDDRS